MLYSLVEERTVMFFVLIIHYCELITYSHHLGAGFCSHCENRLLGVLGPRTCNSLLSTFSTEVKALLKTSSLLYFSSFFLRKFPLNGINWCVPICTVLKQNCISFTVFLVKTLLLFFCCYLPASPCPVCPGPEVQIYSEVTSVFASQRFHLLLGSHYFYSLFASALSHLPPVLSRAKLAPFPSHSCPPFQAFFTLYAKTKKKKEKEEKGRLVLPWQ